MITAQTMAAMDDDHLIQSLRAAYDPITSTPVEVELLKRFERALDTVSPAMAKAIEEHNIALADLESFEDIEDIPEAVALIKALADEEITDVEQWGERKRLLDELDTYGLETAAALRAELELAHRFRSLAIDAGDLFVRLNQLSQENQSA